MSGSKRHILIADDNEHNRELLVHQLDHMGYTTSEVEDGEEALEAIRANPPSLVLLDWMMPRLDGVSVCEALRADPATAEIPVILVTARSGSRDIVEGLKAGANDYITKPIDFDVLFARMETHLRLRDLQLQVRRSNERMIHELRAARAAQETLLPTPERLDTLPFSYGIRVAAYWKPGAMMGGDTWDVLALADGSLGIAMFDFSGSGVVPALHTFRIKSFLEGQCTALYHPALTMTRINGALKTMLSEWEVATCLYARFDPDRSTFGIVTAGTPPPILYRARTKCVERIKARGLPVGSMADATWEDVTVQMKPGDKIAFFTDGLLKLSPGEDQEDAYSEERLAALLSSRGDLEPAELVQAIEEDLENFSNNGDDRDDVTVVIAEITG